MANDAEISAGGGSAAFVTGLLVGAGAALLLAPCSGRDTRERLLGYAEQTKNRWNRLAEKAEGETRNAVEKGQEYVQEKTAQAKDMFRSQVAGDKRQPT